MYVSSDVSRTREPVSIERLAFAKLVLSEARWKDDDPLRRRLSELGSQAGLTIEPFVEVEFQSAALELASNGVADTCLLYTSPSPRD